MPAASKQRRPSFGTVSIRIFDLYSPDALQHPHFGRLESSSGLVDSRSRWSKVSPLELLTSTRAPLETFFQAVCVRVAPRKRGLRKRKSARASTPSEHTQTTRLAVTADGRQGLSLLS